jgi:hypothetical protein
MRDLPTKKSPGKKTVTLRISSKPPPLRVSQSLHDVGGIYPSFVPGNSILAKTPHVNEKNHSACDSSYEMSHVHTQAASFSGDVRENCEREFTPEPVHRFGIDTVENKPT